MMPDILQYLLDICGTSKKSTNMEPRTPYVSQEYLKMYELETFSKMTFYKYGYLKCEHIETYGRTLFGNHKN